MGTISGCPIWLWPNCAVSPLQNLCYLSWEVDSILFILWLEPSASMLPEKQGWSWILILCLKNGKSGSNFSLGASHYPIFSHFSTVTLSLEVSSLSLLPDVFIHWMNCQFPVVAGNQMFGQALLVSVTILWSWAVGILGEGHIGSISAKCLQMARAVGIPWPFWEVAPLSLLSLTICTLPLLLHNPWSEKSQQSS